MRLSRPCYDKPHRCPGWAGGGWRYAKKADRCWNGSIRVRAHDVVDGELYPGYPGDGAHRWRFGHCDKCDVVTWPFAFRKADPTYWAGEFRCWWWNVKWKLTHRKRDGR